jgi:glycogen operon protein
MGRTQRGNNNAYCQDSELSWFDWSLVDKNQALVTLVSWLAQLRREHPVFRHGRWLTGPQAADPSAADIAWFSADGTQMDDEDWHGEAGVLGALLNGEGIHARGPMGEHIVDDSFLMLFNGDASGATFTVPDAAWGREWVRMLDTSLSGPDDVEGAPRIAAGEPVALPDRSVVLLRRVGT